MNLSEKTVTFLATGGYAGLIPVAPGTFGSAVGLLVAWALSPLGLIASLPVVACLILCSIWIAGRAEKIMGRKDPGCIVIDEIAGIAVTFVGLPFSWMSVVAGFLIFRCLDIAKPFPIRYVEKTLPGGSGVVMDDVVAGVMSNFILRAVLWVLVS